VKNWAEFEMSDEVPSPGPVENPPERLSWYRGEVLDGKMDWDLFDSGVTILGTDDMNNPEVQAIWEEAWRSGHMTAEEKKQEEEDLFRRISKTLSECK
jgi:hypothetical protein